MSDVLFIDEIHRLPRAVEELLYPAMEDSLVPFVMDAGRTMNIPLRPFTLIGAAGKGAEVRPKLRAVFPVTVVLQPYSEAELSDIARLCARAGLSLSPGAASQIGRSSGGSLRKVRSALQLAGRPGAVEYQADASTALPSSGIRLMVL
jgi:Holliday junction DNA helicase RuvB